MDARMTKNRTSLELPAAPLAFFGRERERALLRAALLPGRSVALLGTGGVGKTRLAQISFADVPEGGAVWLNAAGTTAGGLQGALDAYAAQRQRMTLLVIDGCEHLASEALALARSVSEKRSAAVLLTLRYAESLDGVEAIEILPLSVAQGTAFFIACVQRYAPEFAPTESDRALIEGIVRRLDGLTLAIELAASRFSNHSLTGIFESLARVTPKALRPGANFSGTPNSLEVALASSIDALSPVARSALTAASIFGAGFDVADLAAVLPEEMSRETIDAAVGELVVHRLFVAARNGLLSILAPLRMVAAKNQPNIRERNIVRERLAKRMYALATASTDENNCGIASPLSLADRHDDLCTALDWSIKRAPQFVGNLMLALGTIWIDQGRYADGLRWTASALQKASSLDQFHYAKIIELRFHLAYRTRNIALMDSVAPLLTSLYARLRDRSGLACAYRAVGIANFYAGRGQEALAQLELAVGIARAAKDDRELVASLNALGNIQLQYDGDAVAAEESLQKALELSDRIIWPEIVATLHAGIATTAYALDDLERAERAARLAISLSANLASHERLTVHGIILARILVGQGRCDEAAPFLEEAFATFAQSAQAEYLAAAIDTAALAALRRGFVADAKTLAQSAVGLRKEHAIPDSLWARETRDRLSERLLWLVPQ